MNKTKAVDLIGGMFGLEDGTNPQANDPFFLEKPYIFLINARSALFLLTKWLSPSHVWVPSFLCREILKSVKGISKIKYYEIDRDLNYTDLRWLKKVQKNDVVLIINYFGFTYGHSIISELKNQGAWVVEDGCQSLLSTTVGRYSDFVLYSPRKFVGVPDGGVLDIRCDIDIPVFDFSDPPIKWWLSSLNASVNRKVFDYCGVDRSWFDNFQRVEEECPIGYYRISELSKNILLNSIDFEYIALKRKKNYLYLLNLLGDFALFPDLPEEIVPLGFPIRLSNRNHVKEILYQNNIFPPIHWEIKSVVPTVFSESHHLASEIMTLICDQRYDYENLEIMASVVIGNARK